MNNKQRKIQATFLATVLLLGSGLGMVSENVKAESATSATVIVDEPFTDLNILTRTKGSYTADMVYTI